MIAGTPPAMGLCVVSPTLFRTTTPLVRTPIFYQCIRQNSIKNGLSVTRINYPIWLLIVPEVNIFCLD